MNPRAATAQAAPLMPFPANTRLTPASALRLEAMRQRDAAIGAALRRLLARVAAWRMRRRAIAELRGLSDRELADIGLTRAGTLAAVHAPEPRATVTPRAANDVATTRAAA